jgi:hypothetical protein
MTNLICIAIMLVSVAGQSKATPSNSTPTQNAIDGALNRMYNCDFAGANAIIMEQIRQHPDDPLLHGIRAAANLFSEFYRLKILELDFFADDDKVTDRKKLKPDPAIHAQLFRMSGEARKLAAARLAVDPKDANAIFALFVASGVETDYTLLVEKKYYRSYRLSKEHQKYAGYLLAMNPPAYDAYLSQGVLEYVVGNLNFFFRLFIHFDQIVGNKQTAIGYLKRVIENGRYYPAYAKMLLSVIYLRENQPLQALALLQELALDFPENPLIRKEIIRISAKIRLSQPGHSSR